MSEISMASSPIDEAILSTLGERWMKVARVIVEVAKAMGGSLSSQAEKYEVIGEHIESLVRDSRLAAQGKVRNWRFNEFRRSNDDRPKTSN
jgi:hypothetical protein